MGLFGIGYSADMSERSIEICPCPPDRTAEAAALALTEIAVDQRAEILRPLARDGQSSEAAFEGLYVALRGKDLLGAAWGQCQAGRTAILWPPQLVDAADFEIAHRLALAAVESLDAQDVEFSQVLLHDRTAPVIPALEAAGFSYLAELVYLTWETAPIRDEASEKLQFESYDESRRGRFLSLIERTYEGTQDCAAMNGLRSMEDVLEGYASTGVFRPELWIMVRAAGEDTGVLLLADHGAAGHWELMYMGVAPGARGRGWGRLIVRHAQELAAKVGVERIVLAVDAANGPALTMYRDTDFIAWDRRTVYVRSAANKISTVRGAR